MRRSGVHLGVHFRSGRPPALAVCGVLAASLSGCSTLPESGRTELAYQVLNAADFAQTVNIARRPDCYIESNPVTSRLIGEHPSTGAVAGAWAAQAMAHYLVSNWLDREVDATDAKGWRVTRSIWQALTIGMAGYNVARNHNMSLRAFGDGIDREHCERAGPVVPHHTRKRSDLRQRPHLACGEPSML